MRLIEYNNNVVYKHKDDDDDGSITALTWYYLDRRFSNGMKNIPHGASIPINVNSHICIFYLSTI